LPEISQKVMPVPIILRSLAGLCIRSDIPLVGLAEASGPPEVVIRLTDAHELSRYRCGDATRPEFRLTVAGVAAFVVAGPREILVAAMPEAREQDIRGFLLGPCLAAIAYWNGVIPLHAGIVDTPGGCLGFVGAAGAGKSTMVGAFAARGYAVRADDMGFMRIGRDGEILVWPGIRTMRLTKEAATALGHAWAGVPADGPPHRKLHVPLASLAEPTEPRALRALYVLDYAEPGAAETIERLSGWRAAEQVIANCYRSHIAHHLGRMGEVVPRCAAAAERVPVYCWRRAAGFERLPESLDRLERHSAALLS
jgi:hypothetical protein